jgi:hypothetical protein
MIMLWGFLGCAHQSDTFLEGLDAYKKKDYATALHVWQPLAQEGHTLAQFFLGFMYAEGEGVTKNEAEAASWYRKAAAKGHAGAQNNLSRMLGSNQAPPTQPGPVTSSAQPVPTMPAAPVSVSPAPPAIAPSSPTQPLTAQTTSVTPIMPVAVPSNPSSSMPSSPTPVQYRHALVIGNTNYPNNPLRNPINDATAMANFLTKEAGFIVYKGRALMDIDRQTFVSAISDFADSIRRGDTVVFYFSGHELERNGQNYLLPVNFAAQNVAQLPYEAPTAQDIQKQLVSGEPDMMIMILDACRNLPEGFKSLQTRSRGGGLAFMSTASGPTTQQVIMFATAPGMTASDGGTLGNGTFTHCFLQSFQRPGIDSRIAFGDVVQCVLDQTNQEQNPFLVTSQRQRFVFK